MTRTAREVTAAVGGVKLVVLVMFGLSQIATTPEPWTVDLLYSVGITGACGAFFAALFLLMSVVYDWIERGD